ncbi:hypothetical protein DDB_G0280417 [Dictyostelium discoideum AX4]|uniref:Uncharacterized protein n=1 Tax=Dictyostelium discoideum TaxID=44689 RepID=Q54VE5_DICDI|nr:hypothetical protein DDB_G0280417 [Dictyostelium discoideum AX4]EAL67187.1 hypothetical protein DDB_G0280417 [Dictyostelium discoideum AX4]|eukprot:XP_641164.1 hypothetical protein DDB_G0280417 [Dictyostelium discoideum AX4]
MKKKIILYSIFLILFLNKIAHGQQEKIKGIFKNEIINKLNREESFLEDYQNLIKQLKGYDSKKIDYYDIFFSDEELNSRKFLSQEFISQYKIFYRDELDKDLNHLLDFNELKSFLQNSKGSEYTDNYIQKFINKNTNNNQNNNENNNENNTINFPTFLKACISFHTDFKNLDPAWKFILNDVSIDRTEEMNTIAQVALERYKRMRREYNQAMTDIDNELSNNLDTFKAEYEQLTEI